MVSKILFLKQTKKISLKPSREKKVVYKYSVVYEVGCTYLSSETNSLWKPLLYAGFDAKSV